MGYGVRLLDARGDDRSQSDQNMFGWDDTHELDAAVASRFERANASRGEDRARTLSALHCRNRDGTVAALR